MLEYILLGLISISTIFLGIYYFQNIYNDDVTELLSFEYNNMKCIKYMYRGKKFIYMTHNLEDTIDTIQKQIDLNSTEKDNLPEIDYKYFKVIITTPNNQDESTINESTINESTTDELMLDAPKLLYSFVGPANTYYFAFDTNFNKKLTLFMNYLFTCESGSIIYGRFSALLEPDKYFDLKTKINMIKKDNSNIEWLLQ